MPLSVEKLTPNSSKAAVEAAISSSIEKLMSEWKSSGRIGKAHPKTEEEARKQAIAVAYSVARSYAGGSKVPAK